MRDFLFLFTPEKELNACRGTLSDIAISGLAGATYIDKTDAARRKLQTTDLVTISAETDRLPRYASAMRHRR